MERDEETRRKCTHYGGRDAMLSDAIAVLPGHGIGVEVTGERIRTWAAGCCRALGAHH